jgi:hypothetical protein
MTTVKSSCAHSTDQLATQDLYTPSLHKAVEKMRRATREIKRKKKPPTAKKLPDLNKLSSFETFRQDISLLVF